MSGVDSEVVDLLKQLVAIDSVNPSLVPRAAGEGEIAEFVSRWATEAGLDAKVLEETRGRPSVIVRSGRIGAGRKLLLCGHLDTVALDGMTDPLRPRMDGDRLYGRGAYDMKGGLAAALIACREAARSGLSGEVVVAAVADEEHSSIGVREALRRVTADAAIVTEPTELEVAVAHRGFVWVEIEVIGKAAHGSRPHLGVDAILKAGPILVALDELDKQLRRRTHPRLAPGNLHGSLISGGTGESTIPARCVLTLERRTLPGETLADVELEVSELLDRCRSADTELVAFSRVLLSREPFETDATIPLVASVSSAATGVLGRPAEIVGVSYWSDAAFISAAGIPTVVFGPAGDGAHADVEWVSLSGTIVCTKGLIDIAKDICA